MSVEKKLKEKPTVPPKPIHLLNNHKLPKPPLLSAEKLGEIVSNIPAADLESEYDIGDYGYSEPANFDPAEGESRQYSFSPQDYRSHGNQPTEKTWNRTHSLNHKEVPELASESNTAKDVGLRQRPLPLLPGEKEESIHHQPWYKVVDRLEGEQLVKNGVDGYFLVRPSSKGESCLTLTLWYKRRTYNIPIRKRPDGLYALGSPKDLEQSFSTVENIIRNYQKEELVLYSHGIEAGRTTLKIYPA